MHPETLTSKAKKLIEPLSSLDKYYLAGETGLALQLGHRKSIDFDFFTPLKIKGALKKLENIFSVPEVKIIVRQSDQLTVFIDSVRVSFISYPFPIFSEFKKWQGLKILSPRSIASMKAYTIGRRATFKDYVDLYYLIKSDIIGLKEIIEKTNQIYGSMFNDRLFLEQLVYFEDIEEQKIKFLHQPITKEEIKVFFEKQIKNFSLD